MTKALAGPDKVSSEHFMVLNGDRPIFIDVAVPLVRLAIEVDGSSHRTLKAMRDDAKRDDSLHKLGWRVLRIKNDCVDQYPEAVKESVANALMDLIRAHKENNDFAE